MGVGNVGFQCVHPSLRLGHLGLHLLQLRDGAGLQGLEGLDAPVMGLDGRQTGFRGLQLALEVLVTQRENQGASSHPLAFLDQDTTDLGRHAGGDHGRAGGLERGSHPGTPIRRTLGHQRDGHLGKYLYLGTGLLVAAGQGSKQRASQGQGEQSCLHGFTPSMGLPVARSRPARLTRSSNRLWRIRVRAP